MNRLSGQNQKPGIESLSTKLALQWNRDPRQPTACAVSNGTLKSEPNPLAGSKYFRFLSKLMHQRFWTVSTSDDLTDFSLIDYSYVETLRRGSIPFQYVLTAPSSSRLRTALNGAIVLVGDITPSDATDVFRDPVTNDIQPGLLIQAAGVYTAAVPPLKEVSEQNHHRIDFVLTLFGILLQTVAVWIYGPKLNEEHFGKLLDMTLLLALLVFGLVVNYSRIFWDGFVLIAIALFIHPYLDRALDRGKKWIPTYIFRKTVNER